jgi:hypothetical protein
MPWLQIFYQRFGFLHLLTIAKLRWLTFSDMAAPVKKASIYFK